MINLKIYCAAVWPGEMFTHAGHSSSRERLNFLFFHQSEKKSNNRRVQMKLVYTSMRCCFFAYVVLD